MSTQVAGAFLSGLGLIGIVVATLLGVMTLLFLPGWALLECAFSRRPRGEKVGIMLVLLFTWGLGSVVYGLFYARSWLLRFATAVTVGAVLLVFVPSVATLMMGARLSTQATADGPPENRQVLEDTFRPGVLPAVQVGSFHAIHSARTGGASTTAAVARFAAASLDAASARDIDRSVHHVVFDPEGQRYWGLTTHDFGAVNASDGRFTRIAPDRAVGDFSWPTGLAFEASTRRVYIATSHVYTRFYRFDARASRWERLPSELRDHPIVGLAHLTSDGCLYALEHRPGDRMLRRLQKFNTEGASLGAVELLPAVPIGDPIDLRVQLVATADALVLLLPPVETSPAVGRLLVIDPATGAVRVPTPVAQVADQR